MKILRSLGGVTSPEQGQADPAAACAASHPAAAMRQTGEARCLTCAMLGAGHKVLAFAHHSVIMDGLEEAVNAEGIGYVRIDGHCSPLQKKAACDRFQTCLKVKAAILSITAAGVSPPCCQTTLTGLQRAAHPDGALFSDL